MFVTAYRSQSISPHSCTYRQYTSNRTYSCHCMPNKVSENVLYPGNKYASHYTSVRTVLMLYLMLLMFFTKTYIACVLRNLFPISIGCSSYNFSAFYGNNLARNINTQYYLLRHALITSRRHNYKT